MIEEYSTMTDLKKHLARSLKRLRWLHNYTQDGFSIRCGLSVRRMQRLESGDYSMTLEEFVLISSSLKIDVSTLMGSEIFFAFDQRIKEMEYALKVKNEKWKETPPGMIERMKEIDEQMRNR